MTHTIPQLITWLTSFPNPAACQRRPTLYTTADMAHYLGVHPRTLTRWARASTPGHVTAEDLTDANNRRLWDSDRIGYDASRGRATLKSPSVSILWPILMDGDHVAITLPQLAVRTGFSPSALAARLSYPTHHARIKQGIHDVRAWVIPTAALVDLCAERV